MIHIYLYDGSFEGMLTAIYEAYYEKDKPDRIVAAADHQPTFLETSRAVQTDVEKADKVYRAIKNKISASALRCTYKGYLSDHPEAANLIFAYLKLGWKMGPKVDLDLVHPAVLPMHRLVRKVDTEHHRLLGLLRFQLVDQGLYYAPVEPDHNVVALLAPHFAERMGDQSWMIHDLKRGIAVLCRQQQWVLTAVEGAFKGQASEEEKQFQALWKTYFKHIAIPERINPRLQKRFMPTRYWKHLIEK